MIMIMGVWKGDALPLFIVQSQASAFKYVCLKLGLNQSVFQYPVVVSEEDVITILCVWELDHF